MCFTGHGDVELMFSKILLVVLFTFVRLNMLCIQSITIIDVPDSLYYIICICIVVFTAATRKEHDHTSTSQLVHAEQKSS